MVANRVGVLVITDSLSWYCLGIEESFSSTRTILLNLLERFLLRTESRASPHLKPELLASPLILLTALAISRTSFNSLGELFPELSLLSWRLRGPASSFF